MKLKNLKTLDEIIFEGKDVINEKREPTKSIEKVII